MINKDDIVDYYLDLCSKLKRKLNRNEYRKYNKKYSTYLIETIWGSWTNFLLYQNYSDTVLPRFEYTKRISSDKVVVTYVQDGSEINIDFFNTLKNYCKDTNSTLCILWGKAISKDRIFSSETYSLIKDFLATEFVLEQDKNCIVKDFLITNTQRNPLLNLDKLSTEYTTVIAGSVKQYLRMLPYKQYSSYRLSYTTGTLSLPEYKMTVAGCLNARYHTFGAIALNFDVSSNRYIPKNLIFSDNCMYDGLKKYTSTSIQIIKSVPGIVLGDLHLPDEDDLALEKTNEMLSRLNPKVAMIHDVASWNSISHHEKFKYFTKLKNRTTCTESLEKELSIVVEKLLHLANNFKGINFKIVNSNHDMFINKFLEDGDFIKDTTNALIGAKLFISYFNNKNVLTDYLPENVEYLEHNTSFKICNYELSEHGDFGISGARGSINSFNKSFNKIIIGHTHSPEIYETTVVVGTLSKLILNYNQNGLTKWAHANCVIYPNETHQLLFC